MAQLDAVRRVGEGKHGGGLVHRAKYASRADRR
jgi:hypothetical protein